MGCCQSDNSNAAHDQEPKGFQASQMVFERKNFEKRYILGDILGQGAFGQVIEVKARDSNRKLALKKINKNQCDKATLASLFSEIEVLKKLDHPNILKVYEFYQDDNFVYIVTELCKGGELFDMITDDAVTMNEKFAAQIIKQTLSSIAFCHGEGIVHRDLKPENILLEKKGDPSSIKVIDFGTAELFRGKKKLHAIIGSAYYIAPEVLKGNYDQKCDVWSIGVILYILLCGYPPFNGDSDEEIFSEIKRAKVQFDPEEWSAASKEAIDLVKKMLTYNPGKRITAADALKHPWITSQSTTSSIAGDAKALTTLKKLKNFNVQAKFKNAAMSYIANQLSNEEQRLEMQKIFNAMDTDGSGTLTKEEVLDGYKKANSTVTKEDVDNLFKVIDTDNSGIITYSEFLTAALSQDQLLSANNLKTAFEVFDADGNGKISLEELKAALKGFELSDEEWRKLIKEVDTDGDGEIDFTEFQGMMKNENFQKVGA